MKSNQPLQISKVARNICKIDPTLYGRSFIAPSCLFLGLCYQLAIVYLLILLKQQHSIDF
jgi:hypothetical protein